MQPAITAYKARTVEIRIVKESPPKSVVWHLNVDRFGPPPFQEQVYVSLNLPGLLFFSPLRQKELDGLWPNEFSHLQLIGTMILMCALWWLTARLWEQEGARQDGLTGVPRGLRIGMRVLFGSFFAFGVGGLLVLIWANATTASSVLELLSDVLGKLPMLLILLSWTAAGFWLMKKRRAQTPPPWARTITFV